MNRKKLLQYYVYSYFIVISILLIACEYNLKNEYYKDLEIPVPRSTIDINDIKDSLYVYDVTEIHYSFKENGQTLYNLRITIDNVTLYNGQDSIAKFTIDPAKFNTGLHKLVLNYITSSGSGSLGDVARAEQFSVSKEYKIYIDNIPPSKLSIKSIKVRDGSLFLEWDKPNKPNYKTITLYANYAYPSSDKTYILNREDTTFKDTLYTGNQVQYYLQLGGYKYSLNSDLAVFDTIGIDINYEIINNNSSIKFYWKQPTLYNNVKGIKVLGYTFTKTDIENGTATAPINLLFGTWYLHWVYLISNDPKIYSWLNTQLNIYLGKKVPNFFSSKLNYEQTNNLYYTVGGNDSTITKDKDLNKYFLYKIDRDSLKVIDYKYIGSNSDAYHSFLSVIDSISGYLLFNDYLYQVDLQTLNISNGKSLMNLLNHKNINYFKVTKNKLLMYSLFNEIISIIDLTTDNIIYSNNKTSSNSSAISDDGKYFYDDIAFYSISVNKAVTKILPVDIEIIPSLAFLPNDEEKCFVRRKENWQLELYDLKTLSFNSCNFTNLSDWGNRNIYCDKYLPDYVGYDTYGSFKLFNYKTNQEIQISLFENSTGIYNFICGGRLFSTRGFALDLNINP